MSLFTRKTFSLKSLALLLVLPTLFASITSFVNGGKDGLKIGEKAPLLTKQMESIDGSSYTLSDLKKENGLIVIFSCNTCPFVVGNDNFPGWEKQYNDIFKAAEANNIGVVLVNSNEAKRDGDDSMSKMITHAKDANYGMPYVIDANSELANALGAKTTPHVYAFDAKTKLVYKGSIDNSWDSKRTTLEKYMYNVIDHLGHKKELKENSTAPRGCSIKRAD